MIIAPIEYNTDNLPVKVTDAEGKISRTECDNEGRVTRLIDAAGNETTYTYDETNATPVSSTVPVAVHYPTYTTRFTYDVMGRVIQEIDDLRDSTTRERSYTYDDGGLLLTSTDEEGKVTRYEYDALGRLVKTTDAANEVVRREYDDRHNLIAVHDPKNGTTYFDYDRNNRMTRIVRPMLQETLFEYDAMGNRTAVIDAKGQKIGYTYDAAGQLEQVDYYAAGDHVTPVKTVTFTYDALGNLKTYADGTTSASYTYDDLSRRTEETIDYGPFALSMHQTYYANGLKQSFTGPDTITQAYAYDEGNRLASIDIAGQGSVSYQYDPASWNRPVKKILPGGSSTDYSYDPLMRLKTLTSRDPGANPVMTRALTYSPSGQVTTKATEHGDYSYTYDPLYRLLTAVNPQGADEDYTYDPMGNRLTAAGITGTWGYNANNQLTGFDQVTFEHDANGNRTKRTEGASEKRYVYDVENPARSGAGSLAGGAGRIRRPDRIVLLRPVRPPAVQRGCRGADIFSILG